MRYGLEDIRGYDSIIPRQYVSYLERLYPQGELLYNRIAPLYSQPGDAAAQAPLNDPLFHLLGVRYVVSTQPVLQPGYRQVYSDGRLLVYENSNVLPRAFIAAEGVAAPGPEAALDRLRSVDPRQTVVVEGISADEIAPPPPRRFARRASAGATCARSSST